MKRFFLFVKVSAVLIWLLPASFAYAQSEDLQKAESELDESVAGLSRENDAEKSEEEIKLENEELAKRVDALEKVLFFTKAEIKELSGKIEGADHKFGDALWDFNREIRKHLSASEKELAGFSSRVEEYSSNLDEIKSLARELKEWREGGYDSKNEAIFDLLLLSKSSRLIDIAESRAKKIDRDLGRLADKFGELGSLQLRVMLAEARLEVGHAKTSQLEGNDIFVDKFGPLFFPEDDGGQETDKDLIGEFASSSDAELNREKGDDGTDADNQVDQSGVVSDEERAMEVYEKEVSLSVEMVLVKIQRSYQIFIDMSELAKKLLSEEK